MNRTSIAIFTALLAAMTAVPAFCAQPGPAADADQVGDNTQPAGQKALTTTVASTTGSAEYRMNDQDAWKVVAVGVELPVGAELRTGIRGQVVLDVGPNAHITVERLSYIVIGRLEKDDQTLHSLLAMQHGKVHFKVDHVGFQNDFKIATPTGTMAVKGTEGDVTSDTSTDIDGNSNNGGNAINYTDSNGNSNNYSGDDSTGNQGGTTTGNSGKDTGNSNTGDGNGNGSGDNTPDTGALHGETEQQQTQQQIQKDTGDLFPGGDNPNGGDNPPVDN